MKNFKTLLLIAVFTLGVSGIANAQKIAHIDFQRVVSNMQETRTLFANLEKEAKTTKADIEQMITNLENKGKKYKAEATTQTEETNKKRQEELQLDTRRIQYAEQTAPREFQSKQNAGLAPIQEKAIKAINEIATSKGILYVMTSGSLLVKNGEDLYEAVKVKLGLLADVKAPVVPQK